ncbi:GPI inositol deacylase [Podila epigama]|nr:GPI inositol deacylase [Podila epigama]
MASNTLSQFEQLQMSGVPALFIPGNAGSAKQVRSIAKEASKYYYGSQGGGGGGRPGSAPIDFFSVDFNEEFTALHGKSLKDQAYFVNEAIAHILSFYSGQGRNKPTSVILLGHSMGGIVARTLFTLDNFRHGSVNTILTVATPHAAPPVALDYETTHIYDTITEFWTRGFSGEGAQLENVTLVSVMGGNLDTTVNGDAANIHSFIPQSHGFTVFTSNIPHAWLSCDHLAILWCNQVASALGQTLVQLVDTRYPEQVGTVAQRLQVFKRRLVTGAHLQQLDSEGATLKNSWEPHLYLWRISEQHRRGFDRLEILTDHNLDPQSRQHILLCKDSAEMSQGSSNLQCTDKHIRVIPIPASTETSTMPLIAGDVFTGQEFRAVSLNLEEIQDFHYVAVMDRGQRFSGPGFLIAKVTRSSDDTQTIPTRTLGLLLRGLEIDLQFNKASWKSTLRLPNLDSGLVSYKLDVRNKHDCKTQGINSTVDANPVCVVPLVKPHFAPMVKQSSWSMFEDKYIVNINGRSSIDINFHGNTPYHPRTHLPGRHGIELQFWKDPASCPGTLSLSLQVDVYGSMGRLLIRYRMAVIVFTFLAIVLTLDLQFKGWNKSGRFQSFGATLSSELARRRFWRFSIALAAIAILQALLAETPVELGGDRGKVASKGAGSNMTFQRDWTPRNTARDMLLGENDPFFWFLAALFFQMAVGITALIWLLLNSLVRLMSLVLLLVTSISKDRNNGAAESSSRQVNIKQVVLCVIIQVIIVETAVPHHFMFVFALVRTLNLCAWELRKATQQTSTRPQTITALNQYHFLSSLLVLLFILLPFAIPGLMVWFRNLKVRWHEPFSSDHQGYYVLPFLVLVEASAKGAIVPRYYGSRSNWLTGGIVVLMVLFGMQYTWLAYVASWLWTVGLLLLYLKDAIKKHA